jgi:hypothetical protein
MYAITDTNQERGEDGWYAYQEQLEALDKSQFLSRDPETNEENCLHCGHAKKLSDGKGLFNVQP